MTEARNMLSATLVRVPCPLCQGNEGNPERVLNGFILERCRRCKFVFVNPRYSEEDLGKCYTNKDSDNLISLYSRIASSSVIESYNRTLDWLEKLVPTRGRLLDFACAAGYFFEQALKRGWDAHGTDLGMWTKEAARARGVPNLHVGRLIDLHFPDHHFDVVYAAQVLEHLPAPNEDLAEIRRILRPGGLLYVDVPNYRTLPIILGRDDFLLNTPPQHINYFTSRSLRTLLQSAGFRDVRITSSDGLKWENLIGRSFESDIKTAYGIGTSESTGPSSAHRPRSRSGVTHMVKRMVVASAIKPIFYDCLKVGMNLIGVARRP